MSAGRRGQVDPLEATREVLLRVVLGAAALGCPGVSVNSDRHNGIPQARGLRKQKFIFPQFRRL